MGLVKNEDLIGWEEFGKKFYCRECGDPGEGGPLTKEDFEEGDVIMCDECDTRIL